MVDTIVFVVGAVVVLSGALGVILSRNPVHSALMLIMTLFGIAVLFVTLWKYELASKHATFQLRALKRRLAEDDDGWVPVRRSAAPQL